MIFQKENANISMLYDELVESGFNPDLVEEVNGVVKITFFSTVNEQAVQDILDNHHSSAFFIVCDENGFIKKSSNEVFNNFELMQNENIYKIPHSMPEGLEVKEYEIPKYRYINEQIVEITDYNDYRLSIPIWKKFMNMRKEEFTIMIEHHNLDELRVFFSSLDEEEKLLFRKCFSDYWATAASTQTDINLAYESMFRILIKKMYIQDVLKREMTTTEQTEYESLLTLFYNHNELIEPYLPGQDWSMPLIARVMSEINGVRFNNVFPSLSYITNPPE